MWVGKNGWINESSSRKEKSTVKPCYIQLLLTKFSNFFKRVKIKINKK